MINPSNRRRSHAKFGPVLAPRPVAPDAVWRDQRIPFHPQGAQASVVMLVTIFLTLMGCKTLPRVPVNLPGTPPHNVPVGAAVEVTFEEVAPGQLMHEWRVVG